MISRGNETFLSFRFQNMIQVSIESGELEKYKGFPSVSKAKLKKRIKMMEDEAKLAEKEGVDGVGDCIDLLRTSL
jgi:hypothetical protein